MKWIFSTAAIVLTLILGGCSSDYVMATRTGHMILTKGKPVIDKETGLVSYTDQAGNEKQLNGDEISSIVER